MAHSYLRARPCQVISGANSLEGRRHFHLLMSRADIGDHLGLTSETVTRTFTLLQRHNYVQVNGRNLEILDPIGLARLAAAVVTI